MVAIIPVLDSGAGPNLIHLQCVAESWRPSIKSVQSPALIDASNRAMKALGEISLFDRIGEVMARILFLVVMGILVDCILGTTFVDHHVKAILPPQRMALFHDAPAVALVWTTPSRHERKMASRSTAQKQPPSDKPEQNEVALPANTPSRKIRLVERATIPPMPQALLRFTTPVEDLCFLKNPPKPAHKNLTLMAHGVMDVVPDKQFSVMPSNFGHRSINILKNTVFSLALPSPTHILTLGEVGRRSIRSQGSGGFNSHSDVASDVEH